MSSSRRGETYRFKLLFRRAVNAIFRIGDQPAARFPLRGSDAGPVQLSLESEADAAGELLGRARFVTPEPVAIGAPGAGYPLPWSVQTWLPGVVATDDDPGQSLAFAHDLAEFVHGVRAIDTRGRSFRGTGRGGDLEAHDARVVTCFRKSKQILDVPRLRHMWETMQDLPRGSATDVMTRGDLIPGNLLVSNVRLVGVIDVAASDPLTPLSTSSARGTCSRTVRGARFVMTSGATTSNGNAAKPGHSNKRSVQFGTTSRAITA